MPLTKEQQNQIEQNRLKALELLKVKHPQRYKKFKEKEKARKENVVKSRQSNSGSAAAATDAATATASRL